jgi:hypothetical protein
VLPATFQLERTRGSVKGKTMNIGKDSLLEDFAGLVGTGAVPEAVLN